ncbi:AAA family ATPase [Campylobacter sp. RM16187]|uniref:AAA family ATPase n=1 Tax=Campylobacter sp. RM16187 TaxID=1660063 RepID=UPI0021B5ABC9|nr:AAA family ATPase [Campylobacter sp. RM16187]QKG28925.1 ATP-dependent Clp protease, ATP-binding subunit [Campylobacter sp. RM16187]
MSEWIKKFERDSNLKSAILLNGNTSDIIKGKTGKYVNNIDFIIHMLNDNFSNVILWDRISGISKLSKISGGFYDSIQDNLDDDEENYDIGEDNKNNNNNNNTGKYKDINEFFGFMLQKINSKTCFILDYSDYIFSSNSSMSDQEKQWLAILKKSINENAIYDLLNTDMIRQGCLIVILTQKLATIPSSFYVGDPNISTITMPMPSRSKRYEFIEYIEPMIEFEPMLDKPKLNDFIDALDGFSLKDIAQIIKLSKLSKSKLSYEKTINLYKYGESKSPWEDLNRDKLFNIQEILKERVKGQNEAIEKVESVIIRAFTGFSGLQHSTKIKKPKGVLFFVGPTGVGNTELAKSLANFLFGDETACIRFDMSEFNHEHSDQRLVGAPPGYVGYEEGGQLTNAIKAKPFSVLLFDEIEKAHGKILDKFLQILEDGRLTDGKGETVSFAESVIIFTSNIGASDTVNSDNEKEVKRQFLEKVKEHFIVTLKRPELLNRIGDNNIVPFNFINSDIFLIEIAKSKFEKIKQFVKEKYKTSDIKFDDEEKTYKILASKVDKNSGGRGVLNMLESHIVNPLSEFVFENFDSLSGREITIKIENEKFGTFEFELN